MVQKWDNIDFEVILRLLKSEIHLRELSKEIKVPHSTLARRLAFLRNKLVIDYRVEGKNYIYFLRKNMIALKAAINAENYKFIKTVEKYKLLLSVFEQVVNTSGCSLIILFGSYAKGIPKEESDIDIYIETQDKKIKERIENLYPNLSIKIGIFDKEDLLIKEIIKNHVIIRGAEIYYEKFGFFK
mgnify:CR=1 FL=1